VNHYEDPGWGPVLRRWPLFFLPGTPLLMFPLLQRRGGFDGLTALRIFWLTYVQALVLFLLVLALIEPAVGSPDEGYLLVLIAVQMLALGGVVWSRTRPLDTSSVAKLAGSYRTLFFVGVAFAESVALFGFVGVFLVEELWPYLEALPLGLLGLALLAPTCRDIARRQQPITAKGSSLSLGGALMQLGPPLGR
jgi:hypothetical protein